MASVFVVSIIAVASLFTALVSGILGMAGGMMLMGVLLTLLPLPAAMMLHGIAQLASNGWRALLLRQQIDWRIVSGYAAGSTWRSDRLPWSGSSWESPRR